MTWWQTLVVALSTLVVAKAVDLIVAIVSEKRAFKKFQREAVYKEIEELKNDVGIWVELASNWVGYEGKQSVYQERFSTDHDLVGKYNKYPAIASAARDTVHWCKIVAYAEREYVDDLIKNKAELQEKFKKFVAVCDDHIRRLA